MSSLIVLGAACLALAQPRLLACYPTASVCETHPHFSQQHAGTHHSHDYLYDLSYVQITQALPTGLIPASLLIALLSINQVLRGIHAPALFKFTRYILIEPPPPRCLLPI